MTSAVATTSHSSASTASRLRAYGLVGAVASLVGAACAVAIIAWDPMVDEDRFSYPFDATSYAIAQSFFVLQHLAMLPLFLGLLILERRHRSRALRIGTWVALAGQVMLTVMEVVAISARDAAIDDSTGTLVGTLYSLPMVLLGVGPLVAGIGALRVGLFDGPARWLLLALGVYVFVVMFPAVFGPMVAGRVAIGVWLLGYAWLGLELIRSARVTTPGRGLGGAGQSPESVDGSESPSMTTTA